MPLPPIQEIIQRYQQQIVNMDVQAMQRLVAAYERSYQTLAAEQDALLQEIVAIQARGGALTQAQIRRMNRYNNLLDDVRAKMGEYAVIIENEVRNDAPGAVYLGLEKAEALTQASLFGEQEVIPEIWGTFQRLPDEAVQAMVAALQETSPLHDILANLGQDTAQGVGDALIKNIMAGKNPITTAAEMAKAWGVPLTRALTISRTEHMRAHRMASIASYQANNHVVKGWIWYAHLDTRTCMSCVAKHGTVFPLSETLDDHPNGRCDALPQTRSWAELGIEGLEDPPPVASPGDGERWFNSQSDADQATMMGPGKYDAWKQGAFTFDQLSKATTDPRWGRMFTETPLKELVGGARKAAVAVPRFKDAGEAAKWLESNQYVGKTYFKGMDVGVAQGIADSLEDMGRRIPSCRNIVEKAGGTREINAEIRKQNKGAVDAAVAKYKKQLEEEADMRIARMGWGQEQKDRYIKMGIKSYTKALQAPPFRMRSGAYAQAHQDKNFVFFNDKFLRNAEALNRSLKQGVELGWSPRGTGTIKALMDHETMHLVDYKYKLSRNQEIINIARQAAKDKTMPSEYAYKNMTEFLSEAWSEYVNSPSPRSVASEVGGIVMRLIREATR